MSYLEDNGTFTFDGVNSADYGVWITGANTYSAPPRRFEEITIPGKNGVLTLDQRAFEDIEHTYPAFIRRNFPSNIEGIRNQLLSRSGKKVLTDSYHPDEFYLAKFMHGVDVEVGSRAIAGRFDLVFKRDPRRFLKSGETPVTIGEWGETTEHSGSIATFEAVDSDAVKSLKVSLEPVQSGSGDPSPTNVRPISGWTGAKVTRTGANVWDEEWELGSFNSNGQPSSSSTSIRCKNFIPVAPGQTYYMYSGSGKSNAPWMYGIDKSFLRRSSAYLVNQAFTIPEDVFYIKIALPGTYGTTYNNDISINYPSTDTQYHPYQGTTLAIDWTTEAGTVYGGTIDVATGLLTVDRVKWIPKAVSVSSVTMTDGNAGYKFNNYSAFSGETLVDTSRLLDVTATFLKSGVSNWVTPNSITLGIDGKSFFACLSTDIGISTVSAFNSWITTNGYYIVYPLATPQTIQLTPQQVALLVGTNNIWSDSGDVTVEVGTNPNMLINPTLFASKPLIRVTGYGTLMLGSAAITIANNFAYVDIDSEVGDCYHGTDNANASVSFQQNDFPELAPGATGIAYSGHITKVEITPRWWRL